MFRMCASNSHSYTHLILAVGIVRKPRVWVFITSKYPGTHDIGLPRHSHAYETSKVAWNSQSTRNHGEVDTRPPRGNDGLRMDGTQTRSSKMRYYATPIHPSIGV